MNRFDLDFGYLGSSLGARLVRIREIMELRQEDVARSVGVSRSLISAFEGDLRVPTIEVATRLADTLGVPRDEMLAAIVSARAKRSVNVSEARRL